MWGPWSQLLRKSTSQCYQLLVGEKHLGLRPGSFFWFWPLPILGRKGQVLILRGPLLCDPKIRKQPFITPGWGGPCASHWS